MVHTDLPTGGASDDTRLRRRLTVPKKDTSVCAWIAAQDDLSFSLRLLIRAEIERNGVSDIACGEVTQLPRRGRPPGSGGGSEHSEAEEYTGVSHVESDTQGSESETAESETQKEHVGTASRTPSRAPEQDTAQQKSTSAIDDLMNSIGETSLHP